MTGKFWVVVAIVMHQRYRVLLAADLHNNGTLSAVPLSQRRFEKANEAEIVTSFEMQTDRQRARSLP